MAKKSRKKRYQKMLIAFDNQLILNTILAIGYRHDSKFFIPLIKPLKRAYLKIHSKYKFIIKKALVSWGSGIHEE
jgi:hypothetical protein